MRLSLYLAYPMLLFVFVNSELRFNVSSFVNVILDLRKFYSAATVIFTHPSDKYGDYGDLRITHLVHTCSIMLGRHYVVTLNVHFKKIHKSLRYHHKIVQPLAIVIMPSYDGFLEFMEATKTYEMSFPVWIVLFLYTPGNNTHDYCHNPVGNPFNLAFDTQMLVICHDDEILREWYSVKGETTKVFNLAKWVDNKGFIPLTKLSLYDRKKDMEGVVLRAVTVKDESVSPNHTKNYIAGLYGKVLDELTYSLNFTLQVVSEVHEHGMWNRKNQTWSGVMGEIVSGYADFAIADMSMTSLRVRYVDFTLPLIISRNSLYIKEPGICGVKWFGYFQTFHSRTWIATLTLIALIPLLLCFMKICRGSRNISDLISDNFIYTWGIFCQQALIGTLLLRVLASNESFSLKLLRLMKKESELPVTLIDGFTQICNDRKLAYLVLNALKKSVEMRIPCKLSSVRTERIDNLGMVLSKGNPYTGVINYHLQKFLDNGILMRLRDTRFLTESVESKAYQPVSAVNIVPILSILCMDLNLTSMMHMWSREFSRQRVITVTMTFVNLLSEYNEYRKIVRPLFVIILNSKESINEFASVTKSIRPISFPIWLILFLQDPEHALEAQCKHPTYNIFNVNFNTIMLVFCYGQPILTEWYAISDNRTRTFELATWSPDSGLFLRTRKSLYGRRSDLFGEVVRVASVYNAKNFILLKMNESMKAKELLPLIEEDGFKQICEEKKVAFYTTEVLKNAVHEHCKTVFIETGKSDSIAMILRKESPYTGILNYHIRRFLDNGVMSRLKEEYLSTTNPPKVRLTQVGLRGIAPLLAMVAGGIVLGIFILMLEKAYYVFKSRRKIGLTKKRQSDRVARKPRGRNSKVNVKLPPFYNTNYYGRPIGYWP
ncbi:Probable glutamate receptor [Harpegnathos saltator]|uniref:Probable glutamate receptor n=1 Tax=Harpegnathos saltator TaxID=610380 RepID=E2BPN3_HARSA|nr:Probable glutamate receptor [Harpegnathos saltator]